MQSYRGNGLTNGDCISCNMHLFWNILSSTIQTCDPQGNLQQIGIIQTLAAPGQLTFEALFPF